MYLISFIVGTLLFVAGIFSIVYNERITKWLSWDTRSWAGIKKTKYDTFKKNKHSIYIIQKLRCYMLSIVLIMFGLFLMVDWIFS
ncbi:hypothetical protein HOC13_00845 [Candidatus Woesearchaeota archaeon]|jgi:hypothetical protein|nr:hypothetical protein [Candidatus Woesearchaeota archaeon]